MPIPISTPAVLLHYPTQAVGEVVEGKAYLHGHALPQYNAKRNALRPILIALFNRFSVNSIACWVERVGNTYRQVASPTAAQVRSGSVRRVWSKRSVIKKATRRSHVRVASGGWDPSSTSRASCNSVGYNLR